MNSNKQPFEYDYINNQITGEKIIIEMNEDIKVEEIEPQKISSNLPFELSQKPSDNKKNLIKSLNLQNKNKIFLLNKNTNENAFINSKTIEKSVSNIKISDIEYKNFYSIMYNSKNLFENSQKILSYNDTKTNTDLRISRYANVANINNNNYLIEFTTKENNGRILLYSINNLKNKTVSAKRLHEKTSSAPDTVSYSISNIQRLFKSKLIQKYNNDYKILQKQRKILN